LGGLVECLIVGWVLKASVLRAHISRSGTKLPFVWDILIRYTTPAILAYLFYLSLAADLAKNYGDYPTDQLIIYGVGWMLVCLIAAFCFAFYPWKPEKLKRKHRPEEDPLMV
jgi:NSS family neurotransmitter:Na+ symporter